MAERVRGLLSCQRMRRRSTHLHERELAQHLAHGGLGVGLDVPHVGHHHVQGVLVDELAHQLDAALVGRHLRPHTTRRRHSQRPCLSRHSSGQQHARTTAPLLVVCATAASSAPPAEPHALPSRALQRGKVLGRSRPQSEGTSGHDGLYHSRQKAQAHLRPEV